MFFIIVKLIGAIFIFTFGLKLIGYSAENLSSKKVKQSLIKLSDNKLLACGLGVISTAFCQSSVATNVICISFVNNGSLSVMGACAFEIGSNVGSTLTAQIVSLGSSGFFDLLFLGSLVAIFGFILLSCKNETTKNVGGMLMGFCLVFIAINLLSLEAESLQNFWWFQKLFLIKSPAILLLNGFFITALCQSSSVISTVIIILASKNVLGFSSAIHLIMGANIGTCIPVILACKNKDKTAYFVATFNLIFNIFGVVVYWLVYSISAGGVCDLLRKTSFSVSRQIANFHTIFNVFSGLLCLIVLPQFIRFTKLITEKFLNINVNRVNKNENFVKVK